MKDGTPAPTLLLLGGVPGEAAAMGAALAGDFDCLIAADAGTAWTLMAENFVQAVICAGAIDGLACEDIFDHLRGHWPETMLIVVADAGAETQVAPVQNLEQVLTRPWSATELRVAAASACRAFRLLRENERLSLEMRCLTPARRAERGPRDPLGFETILHAPGSPMVATIAAARQYASFDVPVLLLGEPGTGKAEMARAIHRSSMRSDKPFQAFDCTGLSDAAICAGLFGSRKPEPGTAPVARAGLVRKADHGSLYLAGIEALSPAMQLRVLRLARDGTYEQDGSSEVQTSGARLIFGASGDLHAMMENGAFRADLYYALAVAELTLPPLRDRPGDLALLAQALAETAGRDHAKPVHGISEAALGFMAGYGWPGNLHELENEITRMLILAQEPILGPELISRRILQAAPAEAGDLDEREIMTGDKPLKDRVEAIEARILRETLTRLKWNKSRAAAELGLSRVGLRAKLDRYGIAPPVMEPEEA